MYHRKGRPICAHQNLRIYTQPDCVWQIDSRLGGVCQAVIACICNYSDNLEPLITTRGSNAKGRVGLYFRQTDRLPEGVTLGPELASHRLVYNGHMRAPNRLRLVPHSPSK